MDSLPVPKIADGDSDRREDGVEEFSKHWCVRGNYQQGIFASFTDHDDVIEFGLLERDGDVAVNLLHVTVVLEDDEARMNSMSEFDMDMNFDTCITPERQGRLDAALRFFARWLRGAAE
jgi:hypothetical protein